MTAGVHPAPVGVLGETPLPGHPVVLVEDEEDDDDKKKHHGDQNAHGHAQVVVVLLVEAASSGKLAVVNFVLEFALLLGCIRIVSSFVA